MKWTKELPTEPGWYWYRNEFVEPEVKLLYTRFGTMYVFEGIYATTVQSMTGEWCRVPEPEDDVP